MKLGKSGKPTSIPYKRKEGKPRKKDKFLHICKRFGCIRPTKEIHGGFYRTYCSIQCYRVNRRDNPHGDIFDQNKYA